MAQASRPESPAGGGRAIVVTFEGREIPVPVTVAGDGPPLVALAPLAERLGGTLTVEKDGQSATLVLEGKEIVLGVGSTIATVADEIVSLPQPVVRGAGGLLVPLELLRKAYGSILGYGFDWRPDEGRLSIGPRGAREIPVVLDVVHLQGVTTVALQFAEIPRYSVDQQPGTIVVQMVSDRLQAPPVRKLPPEALVEGIDFGPQQIRLRLREGVKAESYTLDNPFRLVFDIHDASSQLVAPATPSAAPLAPRSGIRTIVIDPGHGGAESGAVGRGGTMEKELTLLLGRELRDSLERRLGVRALLTREADTLVQLDTRPAIANQNKADLFVSIHLNSSIGSGAHGAETYFLANRPSDPRAARAAALENLEQQSLGTDTPQELEMMLWDLAQSYHMTESQRLASMIQEELNAALQLRDRGVKQAPFRVLIGAAMPAVLVELGFVNNPDEETKLGTPAYRTQLIDSLTRAIGRYKLQAEGKPAAAPGTPGTADPNAPPAAAPLAPPASPKGPAAP
jgi:N-acetylmuramoyl-L-alanine amidase